MVKRYLLTDDGDSDWAALDRRIRDLETGLVLFSASITRGFGLRVAIPAGVRLEGLGTLTAGGLILSPQDGGYVQAGSAFVRGSGGGQVGAGGTLIGGDGRISNSSGTNRFNGNVASDGGVSGASGSFAGALGSASLYVTGSSNVGGMYSRGDIASESKISAQGGVEYPWKGVMYSGEAIGLYIEERAEDGVTRANGARSRADDAWTLANGRATQQQVVDVRDYADAIRDYASSIQFWFNKHMDDYHPGGPKAPGNPPVMG